MAEPLVQHVEQTAKLELDDGTRLVGALSVLPDGSLRLTGTRVLRKPAKGQQSPMRTGDTARLLIPDEGAKKGSGASSTVTLESIADDMLTLSFTNAGGESAQQIQNSLAAGARPRASADDLARYSTVLESLEQDSLERMEKPAQALSAESCRPPVRPVHPGPPLELRPEYFL